MKKKQKRALMILLGLVAVGLCAIKLGPIFLGGGSPVANPSKRKNSKGKSSKKRRSRKKALPSKGMSRKSGSKKSGARRTSGSRRAKAGRDGGPQDASEFAPENLKSIAIDLSATRRRKLVYRARGLRDPFAAAAFETQRESDALARMSLRLQGVVRLGDRRLAIIENRVYAEGDEVAGGVTLVEVGETFVVLTDGRNRTRLALTAPTINIEGP